MRPTTLFRRGAPALAVAALLGLVVPRASDEAPRTEEAGQVIAAVPESGGDAAAAREGGSADAAAPRAARAREVTRGVDAADAPRPVLDVRRGEATYYADALHGRTTASGVPYDRNALVAAHRSLPFGTLLRVTNTENGRQVLVRVVDRGPFAPGQQAPAILDLSRRAARELGFIRQGRTLVRAEILEWGEG